MGGVTRGFENYYLIPFFCHAQNRGVVAEISFYNKNLFQ